MTKVGGRRAIQVRRRTDHAPKRVKVAPTPGGEGWLKKKNRFQEKRKSGAALPQEKETYER